VSTVVQAPAAHAAATLIGVDFSSRPTRRKPIVAAVGHSHGAVLKLARLERFETDSAFAAWLAAMPAWIGGFDLPFGLSRPLVEALGWPTDWTASMDHYAQLTRPQIRDTFAAFCAARPVGSKFAARACEAPAGSSPSMKWVNPPVAYMMHAGVPLLRAAGAHFPAHEPPRPGAPRIALEAYPGLTARELLGRRSYKSDDAGKQTPERLIARKDLVDALEQGRSRLGLRLKLTAAQRDALAADGSGDSIDAVLCLLQAAWGQRQPHWGLPAGVDPLEGWIVGA
jgi:hypothetical protein